VTRAGKWGTSRATGSVGPRGRADSGAVGTGPPSRPVGPSAARLGRRDPWGPRGGWIRGDPADCDTSSCVRLVLQQVRRQNNGVVVVLSGGSGNGGGEGARRIDLAGAVLL
jgi:hypothetical protein